MHREISHADQAFAQESNLSLYLLTGLLGLLIGIDLWPVIANWSLLGDLALPTWSRELYGYRWALIAAVLGGARVLYGSLESLLEGRLGADLALAIACIAAILIGEPLVAAEVVFIGMIGECLEAFTFERTQRAIRRIAEVCPRRCWLLRDGQEVRVLTSELKVGDHVVVKPGAKIPVDGIVREGRSAVDQSALTGEALPVEKEPGNEILAGSLNQLGALTIEAVRVGDQTVAGRIIELTARALKDKAPLERTADRLARYFLPVVLGLATLTFVVTLLWHWAPFISAGSRSGLAEAVRLSVYPALAVLVVACPCALILATPAAIIAALGRLAGTGILIKGGSSLERLAGVTAFAFDKTGTLTEGRLELGDVIGLAGTSADELLRAAATAEQRSEHPLARLILQEAAARGLTPQPVAEFQAQPGAGVQGRTADGQVLVVGTRRLLEERGITIPADALGLLEQLDTAGQTALLVARDGMVLGAIGARDRLRPEAADVLNELWSLGIQDIALLTGDRRAAAQAVVDSLALPGMAIQVHAELLPEQKAELLAQLRGTPPTRLVAMVGDGINDAPALARADVGLAIGGTGTDVAAEAGDIVFMGDPLQSLPLLVRLSRETVRIIRQNILIFAFIVNGLGIVLTAWLWPLLAPSAEWYEQAPLAGVIYHQLGSLAVLLNAMRLLWFERSRTSPTWRHLEHGVRRFDQWLEHHFDFDEILHTLSHHWKKTLLGVVGLAAIVYALSGLTVVGADEVAVVRRFGRPLDGQSYLLPGLYWCWPWPVEDVVRVQPDRVRSVEIGFRSLPPDPRGAPAAPTSLAWSSTHGGDGIRRIADEAVMITGDGNLVELQATVRYSIDRAQLHTYLFEVSNAESVIRAAAEAVLREAVAGQPFHDLLTVHREQFQAEVLARLQRRCREYGGHGLGVRFDGLSLHDLHPPGDVVDAYHAVAQAMESRDRQINEAQADALREKRKALWTAQQIELEAEADAYQKIQQAETARTTFLARQRARSRLSLAEEWQLLNEGADAIAAGQDPQSAYQDYQRKRRDRIGLQVFLTDFRLSWEAVVEALKGRDKVLIDSDKVPGRRHLLMVDPEQFRPPPPILLPRQRSNEES